VEYLESVRGKANGSLRRLLPEVLGITDATDLHRAMLGRWLISAVARAFRPGEKCDAMLVLVGRQGAKKSTFFATLGGSFFGDSPLDIGTKEAPIVFGRFWLYELAEMDGITSTKDATAIKHFAAVKSDTYRAPYARGAAQHKRRTVFCGSVNKADFLVDPTGNRRFYCLTVPDDWVVPVALLSSIRDAVWAEVLDMFEAGERWWMERDEDEVREEDAQRYVEEDPWQDAVERWLADRGIVGGPFTTADALGGAMKLDPCDMARQHRVRMAAILRRLRYVDRGSPAGLRGSRVWVRQGQ
jgi:putative DNA primase/helicase